MLRLSERGTSLGRSAEKFLSDHDITVSRHHAIVTIDAMGSVQITDEGSTNGTFSEWQADSRPHRPTRLTDGDRVQLGNQRGPQAGSARPHDEQFQREMFERTVRDTLTACTTEPISSIRSACWPSRALRRGSAWRS